MINRRERLLAALAGKPDGLFRRRNPAAGAVGEIRGTYYAVNGLEAT